jgi:hypothetical protein
MKHSTRWILLVAGAAVLIFGLYYFILPSWSAYAMMGWGFRHFGPRTFPSGSFLGLLIAFIIGLAICKLLFPSSASQSAKEEEDFCPYCGRELERSESVSGVNPEDLGKEKA